MGFLLAANGLLVLYVSVQSSCADYAGKVERNLPKGGSRNPAVICQYLTCDNVEDIAGLASDLYGSCAEPSCAALFVASISSFMLHLHGYVQSTDDQLHGNLTLLDNHTFCN
ncbi:pyrophosphate-energized vacuolar membrane proton pump [Spinacia oleracea]|uniref:H(+)-exporting diphosphatase n=1 Tax=Spinacia oleracea TaxID=3562 RepID=A0ABM3RP51_SPIOL|nr:pyrophosphate-energized vacuolar membrane proton pump-like [Spinacia oleracea]